MTALGSRPWRMHIILLGRSYVWAVEGMAEAESESLKGMIETGAGGKDNEKRKGKKKKKKLINSTYTLPYAKLY